MPKLFYFKSKKEINSLKNIESFIHRCKYDLTVFGSDLDWKNVKWKGVVNFSKIGVHSKLINETNVLDIEIMDFAKAYVRYQQGHNPTKLKNEIKAIRCIEPALIKIKGKADITLVDITVLDEAIVIATENYKSTAYQAGSQLAKLVAFLMDNSMLKLNVIWKNPLSKPKELSCTDKKTKKKRENKIPPNYVLEYMAEMFANDLQDNRDRYITATFALCMCAPSRISEIQDLRINCLHREKDRNGIERVGLRFYSGKGYGPDIKWISTPFVEIAEEAVKRLAELSRPGHKLAKWIEQNPQEIFKHNNCPDVGEYIPLTPLQVCQYLGITSGPKPMCKIRAYFKSYSKFKEGNHSNRNNPITLRFLNTYVHSNLPKEWPWKNKERGIKWSDSLYSMRRYELNNQKETSKLLLWTPGKSGFTQDLSNHSGFNNKNTIWKRHGYQMIDGTPISMRSHQIRHFLNTAAQRGELGQLDIAKWSGRVNIHQNNVYNHMTDDEMVTKVKGVKELAVMSGPLGKIKFNEPVTLNDLNVIGDKIAHVTEFGFCVHDFSMIPCQKYRDCFNCTEQVCIKGDDEKLSRLKNLYKQIKQQLENAKQADKNEYYGSNRWVEHQQRTLDRLEQLIEVMESDDIEDGAIIRMNNDQEFSPLQRALSANKHLKIEIK